MENQKINRDVYEDVTVMVIYLLNGAEILFEEQASAGLKQYRALLTKCIDLMKAESGCKDVLIQNDYICGIFDGRNSLQQTGTIGVRIIEWYRTMREEESAGAGLALGIGIAGGSVMSVVCNSMWELEERRVWIGQVLGRAASLARSASLDGQKRIWTERR